MVWDPATNTAFAKPDRLLDQQRRYALVVTDAVRDPAGAGVEPEPGVPVCGPETLLPDCGRLDEAVTPRRVVAASLFTTLSATAWLEQARTALGGVAPGFERRTGKSVFSFSELSAVTLRMQVGANPSRFEDLSLPFSLISGVDRIAFGSYRSPSFLDQGQTIAAIGTAEPLDIPATINQIQFHALVPAREKPAAGYPVVITGHGFTDNRFVGPSALAGSLAGQGFAVVAINAVGHGYGPDTKLVLLDKSGNTTEVDGGGRGIDFNGDGTIEAQEGCLVLTTEATAGLGDCLRQTVVDLMQLVRAIRAGVDLDGDGQTDLDPDRIYYAGISLGAIYGTMFSAVEPDVRAAVLNVGGGSVVDIVRLGRTYHPYGVDFLRRARAAQSGRRFRRRLAAARPAGQDSRHRRGHRDPGVVRAPGVAPGAGRPAVFRAAVEDRGQAGAVAVREGRPVGPQPRLERAGARRRNARDHLAVSPRSGAPGGSRLWTRIRTPTW